MDDDKYFLTCALQSMLGYKDFKSEIQVEAILAIIRGSKFVCISMPPGFGRSLCFELPAIIQEGRVVIVFSPNLSYIKKHVEFLRSKQFNAHFLSTSTAFKDRKKVLIDLTSNRLTIPLLYVTSEVGIMTYFQELVHSLKERRLLSYVVFNEAHCLSQWGYEFLPFYKYINSAIHMSGSIPVVAVTTTVNDKVIEDICDLLTMKNPKIFKIPMQQINIFYDVWFLDTLSQPLEHVTNFITEVLGFLNPSISMVHRKFGIVYCKEKTVAELIETKLIASGVPTLVCHHKLKERMRSDVESKWISGKANVIIVTYDYGFLHRKPIKCIVYWTLPANIPKYYRESAQCHMDDSGAYCRIYFSIKEYSATKKVLENPSVMCDHKHFKIQLDEYNKLVSYCLLPKCRHSVISEYFGCIRQPCRTNCDFCENRDIVEHRTHLFITYSENIHKIKYSIFDITADTTDKQFTISPDELKEYIERPLEKYSVQNNIPSVSKSTSVEKGNSRVTEQHKDKQKDSSSNTPLSIEDCIETKKKSTVKLIKDNSNTTGANKHHHIQTAHTLLAKYNLNEEISLEPCSSKKEAKINSVLVPTKESKSQLESRTKEIKQVARTRTVENEGRIVNSNSCMPTGPKEARVKRNHRSVAIDTDSTVFGSKRRKIETESKATTAVQIREENQESSKQNERFKDDEVKDVSRDDATVEYLLNKYKLNKDMISLKLCKK